MEPYWADTNGHSVKYESEAAVSSFPYCTESSLNFSTSATAYSEDDAEYATGRRNKASRQDPLSHRIIEKRRRDRMNSCLADLSRLIPPQYQRKGRGRIEKTEIIEMAIRHLKHLQGECLQKDNDYRQGYSDCMKEAAKFLYDSQMQDFCYRMIARLQEHCDEIMKNDCFKARCHGSDNVSASSGSPHNVYHPAAPLSQLRDILASDIEHSNDHNDVKDLSFRNHWNHLNRDEATTTGTSEVLSVCSRDNSSGTTTSSVNNNNCKQSPQAHRSAQAMSTASASAPQQQHTDSSNHDFDSSHEPVLPHETTSMHSPPLSHNHHHHHHHLFHNSMHHPVNGLLMQASRMRNYSESSHDIEHNNNYKYKNHIKERFNQDVHLHDEETSSEHGIAPPDLLASEHSHTHSMSDHSKDGDAELDALPRILLTKKRKLTDNKTSSPLVAADVKPLTFTDIKAEISATKPNNNNNDNLAIATTKLQSSVKHPNNSCVSSMGTCKSFSVPIFALHGQGTYYVPLNVDYNSLIPFLNGIDLLDKSYASMSVVHPISINVNFTPITVPSTFSQVASTAAANLKNKPLPPTSSMTAFAIASSTTPLSVAPTTVLSALTTKPKMEPFTNGCYSLGSYA